MFAITRRLLLAAAAALLGGCASVPPPDAYPPIVFIHGDGNQAMLWQTTVWRFESNGWPRDRLVALDMPWPSARADDAKPQPGRSSSDEQVAYLQAEVDKVLARTGARQVVLFANSRGGNTIRNDVQNHGGARTVSHAILGGTPNHGVWAVHIDGLPDGSEFAGHGPFLQALNRPKDAAGDEVTGPVKWLVIRSDGNDKFAQPDGHWIGKRGVATGVNAASPELKGAQNLVLHGIDHRETSFSPQAFEAAFRFITGRAPATTAVVPEAHPQLSGRITGLGLSATDPASGDFASNLPVPGARIEVYAVDPATAERTGPAAYAKVVGADGAWGPLAVTPGTRYEFVVSAPGYATQHIYRSPFPRSSAIDDIRMRRFAEADRGAGAVVTLWRPRGYLDPARDRMQFDGHAPPGVPPGAGVDSSTLRLPGPARTVTAEFNGERLAGRTWPAREGQLTVLELTE